MFGHKSLFEKYTSICGDNLYFIFRVLIGMMFFGHGAQKTLGWFTQEAPKPLFSMIGIAGVIELAGGLLIMIGLYTRLAAAISAIVMFNAYAMAHGFTGLLSIGFLAQAHWFVKATLITAVIVVLVYGLFTRYAGAVAIFLVLLLSGILFLSAEYFPVVNKGESAILYFVSFLVLIEFGARKWSVEKWLLEREIF